MKCYTIKLFCVKLSVLFLSFNCLNINFAFHLEYWLNEKYQIRERIWDTKPHALHLVFFKLLFYFTSNQWTKITMWPFCHTVIFHGTCMYFIKGLASTTRTIYCILRVFFLLFVKCTVLRSDNQWCCLRSSRKSWIISLR